VGIPLSRLRRLGEGAPFVARRAVNLHGCALPHSALPPAAAPPDPVVCCALRTVFL